MTGNFSDAFILVKSFIIFIIHHIIINVIDKLLF